MRKVPNNSLEILAKTTYNEIRIFYDDPKNNEKFNAWKKQRNRRGQSDLK